MIMDLRQWSMAFCLLLVLVTAGACTNNSPAGNTSDPIAESTAPVEETATPASEPAEFASAGQPKLVGKATVEMQINGGSVVMELDGEAAPVTAGNFVDLVQKGVYEGTVFHRVVKSPEPFVVQGGDPQSKDPSTPSQLYGTGSFVDPETQQPRLIPLEILPEGAEEPVYSQTFEMANVTAPPALPHTRGAVAMARSQPPNSASAQFYVALADLPFLDGNYAVFGYVTEGMDIVDDIQQGNVIEAATVTAGIENLQVE